MQIKLPSELDTVKTVKEIHATDDGIGCWCPDCGLLHTYQSQWPIDIRIVCSSADCECIFIIPNDVAIVE